MGKRLDQLRGLEEGPGRRDDLASSRQEAEEFVALLLNMADNDRYSFCWGMLTDMRLTVEQTGRVTEGQRQAIENVKDGAARHARAQEGWRRHERRTGRRYEGWEPSD